MKFGRRIFCKMAKGGRGLPSLLLGMLWMASFSSCFNLEKRAAQFLDNPYASTQGRESYFGFSVALLHNNGNNTNWVLVGAPRSNSTLNSLTQIIEPGAMFQCNLSSSACQEVLVDRSDNTEIINSLNYGWLGGSLDAQPQFGEGRQIAGVCAPRSIKQSYSDYYMDGVCYWTDYSASPLTFRKELPLDKEKQKYTYVTHRYHAQSGMSIHFPDDQTKFIVGAPGLSSWQGSVILFEDYSFDNSGGVSRRRWQARQQMFQTKLVPNPSAISSINYFDYFGYAVTSGKFLSKDKTLYAGGAPPGAHLYGKVVIFYFKQSEYLDLVTERELKGEQLGEYFGAALTAADINGDGLTDLVVGSPMFSFSSHPDVGRIQTFLSEKGNGLIRQEPHYGKKVSFARFGTSLASPGDLNADKYEDVLVAAPWEDRGAVYVFLGSVNGLRQQYSQRISAEDFLTPHLRGFGMSMSRGIDIDNNGYPDVAIGSFLSGHVAVIRTRPVAELSGQITANPSNVPWEGEAELNLTTCLHYKGYNVPKNYSVEVSLTVDHGSPSPRALFKEHTSIYNFTENLVANSIEPFCRTHQVTVLGDKLHPDQPLNMRLEYDLVSTAETKLNEQPMTNPTEIHSSITQVSISKGCKEKICKVDMMLHADNDLGQDKLIVGQRTKLVLHTVVSNTGEPAYLPAMNVTVEPPLTLILPQSHDCEFFNADLRTSLECRLSNPIKSSVSDVVEVTVDTSLLTDASSSPWIQVNVTGEGEELNSTNNLLSQSLLLEAHATLELHGDSKEEQVFYKHVGEDNINATINPRFTHTFILVKKGPTPLGQVDLTIDIPVNVTDSQKLVKLYPPKTDFLGQPFSCKLNSGSFDRDHGDEASGISIGDSDEIGTNIKSSLKPIIVSAEKEIDEGTWYFNCSSSLIRCVQLSCHIYNWPVDTESAKVTMDLEVDLGVMAKYISVQGGAVLMTSASAHIQSLSSEIQFSGNRVANEEVVTYIQPDFLLGKGIPWWVILLAVLGGLLLLGLLAYGLYKAGFFKREKMEEMKAQRAQSEKKSETPNPGFVED